VDTLVKLDKKVIVGISMQSENKRGKIIEDIEIMKKRFISEKVAEKVQNRVCDDVFLLFTDYGKKGLLGTYLLTLGYEVTSIDNIPDGFTVKEIPPLYYVSSVSDKRDDSSFQKWMKLMQKPELYKMNLKANFDVYRDGLDTLSSTEVGNYASVDVDNVDKSFLEKFRELIFSKKI